MRYIKNVVSDEYGRIMRWEELPEYDESGQAISYTKGGGTVELPEDAEEAFYLYCGKKSKVVDDTVATDMTLPEWKSDIVKRNEQALTIDDLAAAIAELGELLG